MIGSVIDHAIALTCYLTSLDLETWLLLGYGLPHGTTAYVLIREYNRESQIPLHFVYDLVTATKYDIMDILCPLQRIFCVINEQNVNKPHKEYFILSHDLINILGMGKCTKNRSNTINKI